MSRRCINATAQGNGSDTSCWCQPSHTPVGPENRDWADCQRRCDDDAGSPIDLNALSDLAGHVYSTMHIHPDSELGITLVDIDRITSLHEDWMNEPGPTDVVSFPIDELVPGTPEALSGPGMLGDIVICPEFAQADAAAAERVCRSGLRVGEWCGGVVQVGERDEVAVCVVAVLDGLSRCDEHRFQKRCGWRGGSVL